MKRILLFFSSLILLASAQSYAADDSLTKAMKLYERRHYGEAAAVLNSDTTSIDQSRQGMANLTLRIVYLSNSLFACVIPGRGFCITGLFEKAGRRPPWPSQKPFRRFLSR